MLSSGIDAVGTVPDGRWPQIPKEIATSCGGFLNSVDRFDAPFFGISPREAAYLDPQHRLLLEVSWEALEDAGLPADRLGGESVGVFVGVSSNDYGRILAAGPGLEDAYSVTGNSASMAANRISYHFDFRGPSLAVDTACSSSLVSVHLACESLRRGECQVALAGGVNLILTPKVSVTLTRAMMLSRSGRCRTFDASADGYVRGEGCGVVVLKPLSVALRDGNRVLALILGSAVNQDGKSNGITAPNSQAQASLIRAALADAGIEPAQVGYVESHGTGTVLGDPIEFSALKAALAAGSTPCAVSTVKTNLGHLESAAGVAGLMKAVLQLRHGAIAPHLHLKALNPLIELEGTRFFIPSELVPWPEGPAPRVAGVRLIRLWRLQRTRRSIRSTGPGRAVRAPGPARPPVDGIGTYRACTPGAGVPVPRRSHRGCDGGRRGRRLHSQRRAVAPNPSARHPRERKGRSRFGAGGIPLRNSRATACTPHAQPASRRPASLSSSRGRVASARAWAGCCTRPARRSAMPSRTARPS